MTMHKPITYLVTVYERWEYGTNWSYTVRTNCIDSVRQGLKNQYNRFTIEEL